MDYSLLKDREFWVNCDHFINDFSAKVRQRAEDVIRSWQDKGRLEAVIAARKDYRTFIQTVMQEVAKETFSQARLL